LGPLVGRVLGAYALGGEIKGEVAAAGRRRRTLAGKGIGAQRRPTNNRADKEEKKLFCLSFTRMNARWTHPVGRGAFVLIACAYPTPKNKLLPSIK